MKHSIMVFAPHQDDEVLHCAGTLWRAAQEGADICVCFVTNGEYEDESLAAVRSAESLKALSKLGVPEEAAVFLGYADTGMPYEKSFLYRLFYDNDGVRLPSHWGKTETWGPGGRSEYRLLRDGTHSPYTRAAVLRDLTELLGEKRPDEIYVTSPGDLHGDHAGLGLFVQEAVAALRKDDASWAPELYHFIIHTADEDAWPPRESESFPPPADAAARGLDWENRIVRPLPAGMPDKRELLFTYASQEPHAYGDFLLGFVKPEELLFPLEAKM